MEEQPVINRIIDLLFSADEDPFFIDGTVPIEEIARDPSAFLSSASAHFGIAIGAAHLKMSIPQLARFIIDTHIE
jgi:hypothetical protein